MTSRSKTALVPALPILGAFEAGRITPFRLGVLLALAMLGARGLAFSISETGPFSTGNGTVPGDLREVRIGFVLALVIGYAPAAYGWGVRSLRATLEGLRPIFGERGEPLDLALSATGIAVATTAFLLPVRGVRRRIVEEKQAELGRVRRAIRGDGGALRESPLAAWREQMAVADLLAYEARIEAVREWPFDVPTLARLLAFVLLPIGSWLGGALVEQIVSRLLD